MKGMNLMKRTFLGKMLTVVLTAALVLAMMLPVTSNALIYSDEHSACWYVDDESDVTSGLVEGYNPVAISMLADQIDGIDVMSCVITAGDPYLHWAIADTDISGFNYAVMYAYYQTENVDCYEEYAVGSFRIQASGDGKNFWTMNWGLKYKANEWVKYIIDLSNPDNPDMKFYDNNGTGWDWHECYSAGMKIEGIRVTFVNDGLSNDPRLYGDVVNVKCVAFFDTMEAAEAFSPFADYTAVDAAIAAVPADLSQFNTTTSAAVTSAVNNVVRNLSPYDQVLVDMYAEKINAAVAALSAEPDPTEAPTEAPADPTEAPTEAPAEATKAPSSDSEEKKDGGLGTGAIIGIIAAAVVVIAAVIVIVLKKKK